MNNKLDMKHITVLQPTPKFLHWCLRTIFDMSGEYIQIHSSIGGEAMVHIAKQEIISNINRCSMGEATMLSDNYTENLRYM